MYIYIGIALKVSSSFYIKHSTAAVLQRQQPPVVLILTVVDLCRIDCEVWTVSYNACLTAIFQHNLDKPAPECLHSGYYWS